MGFIILWWLKLRIEEEITSGSGEQLDLVRLYSDKESVSLEMPGCFIEYEGDFYLFLDYLKIECPKDGEGDYDLGALALITCDVIAALDELMSKRYTFIPILSEGEDDTGLYTILRCRLKLSVLDLLTVRSFRRILVGVTQDLETLGKEIIKSQIEKVKSIVEEHR